MPIDQINGTLGQLREEIDDLDQRIIDLLNQRAKVVVQIGHAKRNGAGPVYAPDREQAVLAKVRKNNHGPLPDSCVEAVWRELMSGSFALEKPLRIGYLGPEGSFSHMAAKRKFGASVEYGGLDSISSVFDEISRGHMDLGLVPIENSAIGGIGETLDSFLDSNLQVCAEVLINIHHNLLSNSAPEEIKCIYSKPEALAQCKKWLSHQLLSARHLAAASTSEAARMASEQKGAAAVGSALAGEVYNLKIQFANIEDNPNNTTRFFVIGKQSPKPTGDDKTSLMFAIDHKAGALTGVLDVFRDYGLNLMHIDKRPSKKINWEYCFFVDLLGHKQDKNVQKAIDQASQHCHSLTILGSFPRAQEVL